MIGATTKELVKSSEKVKKVLQKVKGQKKEESEKNKFNIFEGLESEIESDEK